MGRMGERRSIPLKVRRAAGSSPPAKRLRIARSVQDFSATRGLGSKAVAPGAVEFRAAGGARSKEQLPTVEGQAEGEQQYKEPTGTSDRTCRQRGAWTVQFGTPASDSAKGLVVDANGDLSLVGTTDGALGASGNHGMTDTFVRMISGVDGSELWTVQFGTSEDDFAGDIAIDAEGNLLVCGETFGDLGGAGNFGASDVFVRKLSSRDGTAMWTRQVGSPDEDDCRDLTVAEDGYIYITGATSGAWKDVDDPGLNDAYVHKLSSADGSEVWTHQLGSPNVDLGTALTMSSEGNIFVAGHMWDLGTGAEEMDTFVRELSSATGQEIWSTRFGTPGADRASQLLVDAEFLYVAGYTSGVFATDTYRRGARRARGRSG